MARTLTGQAAARRIGSHPVHHRDAQLIIINADVDMHATNHHPSSKSLQVIGDGVIALLVGVALNRSE